MEKQILKEIKELKFILSKLVGSSEDAPKTWFSVEKLDIAAKQFQKLQMERGEWIKDKNISKFIKKAPWRAGSFIREEFEFTNCFRYKHDYYFSKKDLIKLSDALKARNINLDRYMDLVRDKKEFDKKMDSLKQEKKKTPKKPPFRIPAGVKDIDTDEIPRPSVEVVRQDITRLKQECFDLKLSDFIDIYDSNYAMVKNIYFFEKYLEPGLKRRCKKWCDDFNYANHALKLLTGKTASFNTVKESDMIEL